MKKDRFLLPKLIITISCALLFVISCNKQKKPAVNSAPPLLAPCEFPENTMTIFSIIANTTLEYIGSFTSETPDVPFENCHYYVRLKTNTSDARSHFYFTEEPKTGIYHPSFGFSLDSSSAIGIRHEVSIHNGLTMVIWPSGDPVHVNNQNGKITISWCNVYYMVEGNEMNYYPSKARITFDK